MKNSETEHFACALQMQSMQYQIEELTNMLRNAELALATVTKERDELVEALRKAVLWADCASHHMKNRHEINWTDLNEAKEVLSSIKNQKTDSISCPECDALASYGSNDGPCDAHKK